MPTLVALIQRGQPSGQVGCNQGPYFEDGGFTGEASQSSAWGKEDRMKRLFVVASVILLLVPGAASAHFRSHFDGNDSASPLDFKFISSEVRGEEDDGYREYGNSFSPRGGNRER
jgi:hypothetical protein